MTISLLSVEGAPPSNPKVVVTPAQLAHWNRALAEKLPQEVLQWAMVTFPNLFQTTAFGLTGLATVDMVSKLKNPESPRHPIELIFIDTLHHFPQTLALVDKLSEKYGLSTTRDLHIYKPQGLDTELEFAAKHGELLWEKDDGLYDFLVKVEPSQRAYRELGVAAVLTGRRKTQGGARGALPVVEIEELSGTIKINPLHDWTFSQVQEYIAENQVPYNELLDLGYRSVGDYHSTVPVAEGEDERAGRWKGTGKTECGIHEASKFKQYLSHQV